mmetsp:Transcript_47862/g.154300  ORF Transcript_47862/g.154300 Transcript_47862/m.154300 type:complete len:207 (-) Transcript_47862:2365-2985(-)
MVSTSPPLGLPSRAAPPREDETGTASAGGAKGLAAAATASGASNSSLCSLSAIKSATAIVQLRRVSHWLLMALPPKLRSVAMSTWPSTYLSTTSGTEGLAPREACRSFPRSCSVRRRQSGSQACGEFSEVADAAHASDPSDVGSEGATISAHVEGAHSTPAVPAAAAAEKRSNKSCVRARIPCKCVNEQGEPVASGTRLVRRWCRR